MLGKKRVAVVVPAYNEESQIGIVIETMPEFVDKIVIVNDFSKDKTLAVVEKYFGKLKCGSDINKKNLDLSDNIFNYAERIANEMLTKEEILFNPAKILHDVADDKIVLINHTQNGGVGAAIATGYKWCRDHEIECTAVMAGDAQMDPSELFSICEPVINDDVDYVKGNRLIHKSTHTVIPRVRFIGNSILSILTKVASGYWHISDTQTGYTAISLNALKSIDLYDIYPRYGMPNDMLVKLNIAYCTVKEIPIKPVYGVGEQSKMNIKKVIPKISFLLVRGFLKRLFVKYFFRDFHPLFVFYSLFFVTSLGSVPFLVMIVNALIKELPITTGTYLAFILLVIFSFQSLGQAMSLDIQDNERLYKYN